MAGRSITSPGARVETGDAVDPTGQGRSRTGPTGRVALYAFTAWTKRPELVAASLTPADARELAADLLVAAERAEGKHRNR